MECTGRKQDGKERTCFSYILTFYFGDWDCEVSVCLISVATTVLGTVLPLVAVLPHSLFFSVAEEQTSYTSNQ